MKEEWKKVKLGELYEVHNGLSKGGKFFGSGYPFLSFSTIFNNWFIPEIIKDLVQSTEVERANFSVKAGDVFITRTSETADELGMSCVALKDYPNATYNGFCKRLRPIESDYSLNYKYIGYYLRTKSFRNNFLGLSGAMTTRASLKNDDLLAMEITLPPLPTQQKIASILSAYDDLIENNRKQIKLLEEASLKLYKEWFVKLNFPGHENTKIVDGVPEGWKETTIGDIVKIKSGFAFKSEWWQEKGYPVVKIKDIGNNTLNITSFDFVSEERTLKCKDFLLNEGDLVIAMTGATIGKIGLVPKIDNLYTNQRVGKFFPNDKDEWQTPFLFCFYNSDLIQDQIIALSSSSSAQPNISGNQLENFKVILNKNLVNFFNRITGPLFKKILRCQIEIQKCQLARDKLLPKLMNGEIEV